MQVEFSLGEITSSEDNRKFKKPLRSLGEFPGRFINTHTVKLSGLYQKRAPDLKN